MASTIAATLTDALNVVETFTGSNVSAADNTATFALSDTTALSGSTTPAVTKHSGGELALTAGAATIDLTALPGRTADQTVDGTGLRVQMIKFRNKSTNANTITIAEGAANGYTGLGSGFSLTLGPGARACFYLDDEGPDISGTVKDLDITGTGTQVLVYEVVMG